MKPEGPGKKTDLVRFRVPSPLKESFMARMRDEGRVASDVFREFMEDYLTRPAQRTTQTLETAMTAIRKRPRTSAGAAAILAAASISAVIAGAIPAGAEPDLRERFAERDSNGDGVIDREEYGALVRYGGQPDAPDWAEKQENAVNQDLSRHDADGNGGLSLEEYIARAVDLADRAFASADRDGDGLITAQEATSPRFITERRPDGEMEITGVAMPPRGLMETMDSDGDGRITREEYRTVSLARAAAARR